MRNTMTCRHTGMQLICQICLEILHAAHAADVQFLSSQLQSLPSQVHTAETCRQFTDSVKQLTQQSEYDNHQRLHTKKAEGHP